MGKLLQMSAKWFISFLLICCLTACSSVGTDGLEGFQSPDGRYGFFYPTGWVRVAVSGGPEVVFHDVINSDETLSLVISDIGDEISLNDVGSPQLVGEKLIREIIAPEGSGRKADLLQANQRDHQGHTFYDIEYSIRLSDRERHELATVVVDRGSLFTLAASTSETRWPKVKSIFERVIDSFSFFI